MDLECPYCEYPVQPGEEDREEDIPYERECPHCDMVFTYYINYTINYTSQKAPCLNGEEHDFQKIKGYPEEFFRNKYRCSYCEQEVVIKEDDIGVNS